MKDENGKSIEEIIHQRERLDEILQKEFTKKKTILFSDVCGYTRYMDARGDIGGRVWMQKHHDIVLPLIEENGGRVLSIMGDGVMASFDASPPAVKAAVEIQKGLDRHNRKTDSADMIHVKIGVHTGGILVDDSHIAGDVVNVASRIQNQAGPDRILVSEEVHREIRGEDDILSRFHESVRVKGKPEPLELYRVIWREEDPADRPEPVMRASDGGGPGRPRGRADGAVFHLEAARDGDLIKISAHEQAPGALNTIRRYEEVRVAAGWIEERCLDMVRTLNKANREGGLPREALTRLRDTGRVFSDVLITPDIDEMLRKTAAEHLTLHLDDHLVHIPWELLHDGEEFLCQKFGMGRLVKTRQTAPMGRPHALARPLNMLILADPGGDLKGASREGAQLRDFMERDKKLFNTALWSDEITRESIKSKMRKYDFVHFAGHADYDPDNPEERGWRLTDGGFNPRDIVRMAGGGPMPSLILSNACQSARTGEWAIKERFQNEIFGLANAFLLSGVRHYVGTSWEVQDDLSRSFALAFYEKLVAGRTIGQAVREARMALIREYGESTIVWAGYLLYGDPTFNYMDQIRPGEPGEPPADPGAAPRPRERTREKTRQDVARSSEKETGKKRRTGLMAGAALLLVLLLALGWHGLSERSARRLEAAAAADYESGDFQGALEACKSLEEKKRGGTLTNLIRGRILLRNGSPDAAEAAFQAALRASGGTDSQRADALMGLGRVASIRGKPGDALDSYRRASDLAPGNGAALLSRAIVLENEKKYDQALDLMETAREKSPGDPVMAAVAGEIREKALVAANEGKRARIDGLVRDLLKQMEAPARAAPSDGWTSPPATLCVLDFTTRGYSLQEGDVRLLTAGLTDRLLERGRIQLVERALLDAMLEELKMGSSRLADPTAALSLGKLLAARLLLTGGVVFSGPQCQASIRLIETETGRITASVSESLAGPAPLSTAAPRLADAILEKMESLYPLRGKILEATDREIWLNIGAAAGVRPGDRFKSASGEAVLEVVSVEPDKSRARLAEGEAPPQPWERVELGNGN
ncbi:MAG: CHAT domain-containing protein [Desulfobacterales bacterium]|nr:CHAT domain-containing protein [Desulfobacterales bacterium]